MSETLEAILIPENLKVEEGWIVQGRIIPPSCSRGEGCILYLQVQGKDWNNEHFHIGRSPIPPEMGVEVVTSILVPFQEILVCCSLDPIEREAEVDYLSMIKLARPEDTIGFLTTTGLVFLIQIQGLNSMFGKAPGCRYCNTLATALLADFDGNLDDVMAIEKTDERSH